MEYFSKETAELHTEVSRNYCLKQSKNLDKLTTTKFWNPTTEIKLIDWSEESFD